MTDNQTKVYIASKELEENKRHNLEEERRKAGEAAVDAKLKEKQGNKFEAETVKAYVTSATDTLKTVLPWKLV